MPSTTRIFLAPHTYVSPAIFQLSGPGRGLLSNPFLPTPPCRFGTAMAGAYDLMGGRDGTAEVCLVGVQSDFPAPAVHRERQQPDRPGPRPLCPSQAVHAEKESGAYSGTPRDNRLRFGAPNIRRKRMPTLLRAHPQRKLAHTALDVDCFWGFTPDFQSWIMAACVFKVEANVM